MYLTRDITEDGLLCLWNCKADELKQTYGSEWYEWYVMDNDELITLSPKEFKQMFPNQKLPRKGSRKYVELKLYIPGEK